MGTASGGVYHRSTIFSGESEYITRYKTVVPYCTFWTKMKHRNIILWIYSSNSFFYKWALVFHQKKFSGMAAVF